MGEHLEIRPKGRVGSSPPPPTKKPQLPGRRLGLTWGQCLGRPECPYMQRWVFNFGFFSIRFHRWFSSDDDRHFHDHPWWYLTLVLRGGYTDVSPAGEDVLRTGSIRWRSALHRHTVKVNAGGCWTLMLTGPEVRRWGFWVNGKLKMVWRYFFDYGHHPCE